MESHPRICEKVSFKTIRFPDDFRIEVPGWWKRETMVWGFRETSESYTTREEGLPGLNHS